MKRAVRYLLVAGYPLDSPATTRGDFHAVGEAIDDVLFYEARLLSGQDWYHLLRKGEEVLDRAAEKGWRNGGRYDDGGNLPWLFRLTGPLNEANDASDGQESARCVFIHQKAPDALLHFLRTCERHEHLVDDVPHYLQAIGDLLGCSANGEKIFPYPDPAPPRAALASPEGTQLAASNGERDLEQAEKVTSALALEYCLWNVDDWGIGEERNASDSQMNAGRACGEELVSEVERDPEGASSTCLGWLRLC